jgi:hypothetical protein
VKNFLKHLFEQSRGGRLLSEPAPIHPEGGEGSPVTGEEGFHPRGKIVKTLWTGDELHSEKCDVKPKRSWSDCSSRSHSILGRRRSKAVQLKFPGNIDDQNADNFHSQRDAFCDAVDRNQSSTVILICSNYPWQSMK